MNERGSWYSLGELCSMTASGIVVHETEGPHRFMVAEQFLVLHGGPHYLKIPVGVLNSGETAAVAVYLSSYGNGSLAAETLGCAEQTFQNKVSLAKEKLENRFDCLFHRTQLPSLLHEKGLLACFSQEHCAFLSEGWKDDATVLTPAHLELFPFLIQGETYLQTALKLDKSRKTVQNQMYKIGGILREILDSEGSPSELFKLYVSQILYRQCVDMKQDG